MGRGNIKYINSKRGFGFIGNENNDVYFRLTDILSLNEGKFEVGDLVEYEVKKSSKGLMTKNIRLIEKAITYEFRTNISDLKELWNQSLKSTIKDLQNSDHSIIVSTYSSQWLIHYELNPYQYSVYHRHWGNKKFHKQHTPLYSESKFLTLTTEGDLYLNFQYITSHDAVRILESFEILIVSVDYINAERVALLRSELYGSKLPYDKHDIFPKKSDLLERIKNNGQKEWEEAPKWVVNKQTIKPIWTQKLKPYLDATIFDEFVLVMNTKNRQWILEVRNEQDFKNYKLSEKFWGPTKFSKEEILKQSICEEKTYNFVLDVVRYIQRKEADYEGLCEIRLMPDAHFIPFGKYLYNNIQAIDDVPPPDSEKVVILSTFVTSQSLLVSFFREISIYKEISNKEIRRMLMDDKRKNSLALRSLVKTYISKNLNTDVVGETIRYYANLLK
ncbi:cold shock domain-containing protein [Bacillus sp. ISL-45]|uniref:cold-shock protein n=1 Tax=Bacillus sp. ISL-45 TaxID=2819128 RepID=UPI001BEB83C2|nr:cold shock domain-containing protein [Bacillus sp. ISL-45]MBT2663886.1 cold shock domain-containing protein [Bacillus sp. ISL-45]